MVNPSKAVIFGCEGTVLTAQEAEFFCHHQPWGFILFARNCEDPEQIKQLCADLRATIENDKAPILIDQEGGRVARLRPPLAPERPPMDRFGALAETNPANAGLAAFIGAKLVAADLRALGINVNCVPVLDVPQPGAHDIIGDRALAKEPQRIAQLADQIIAGCMSGGVLPIIKHIPGHGRALADSHVSLPRVDASAKELFAIDFAPFKALHDAPMAMTAHVVYEVFDQTNPATTSPVMIDLIRNEIGFSGLLMTDDLSMKALSGPFAERCQQALAAGCDMLLHCNGEMAEMQEIAEHAPILQGQSARRAHDALAWLSDPAEFDREGTEQRFAELLKPVMV
ncbi:MAG: beta-N-acetylhexosaminidase [bacterium]